MLSQQHNTEARVRFGARDWRHADWVAAYYPEDLPNDWQLGYYANELSAVLLDPAAWREESPANLADWAAETHEGFRFYLMLDAKEDVAAQCARAAALADRLGGLLWSGGDVPAGALGAVGDELPEGVRGWGDSAGVRLAMLDLSGQDLRARRVLLEQLAPLLAADGDVAIILDWDDVLPAEVRELQTIAELMGLA
jgi:hypothetical protein